MNKKVKLIILSSMTVACISTAYAKNIDSADLVDFMKNHQAYIGLNSKADLNAFSKEFKIKKLTSIKYQIKDGESIYLIPFTTG